ncbi:hypothetical protein BURPS1106B_1216 [Burkholderia pseudomallei 1106b]|uniref:Uncharacterized protein n=1 Tax=Burkholderia pseudomallei (strain 1106a) TaxID=357348 RepID=A3P398_BURP0|nr:hypothetical protein BURPS1106A_A0771 [Burkholderia pseudomallei 1106a]AFR18749.1 hypothetical protein BPC006_II0818 [Burkholderia pseudomallei BPC006]EBA44586.1 hypothetical protein BURPS305_0278 [Burkholderia pseudomallei 305]EES22054.1 hypothetical protein BURPS1106B_1216 [Burkholderia pseudomallei 1106b]
MRAPPPVKAASARRARASDLDTPAAPRHGIAAARRANAARPARTCGEAKGQADTAG